MSNVNEATLASLLKDARSQNGWRPDAVSDEQLREAYEVADGGLRR